MLISSIQNKVKPQSHFWGHFCTLICECYFLDKYIYLEKQIEDFAQVVTILIDS